MQIIVMNKLILLFTLLSLIFSIGSVSAVTHLTNCSMLNIEGEKYILDNNITPSGMDCFVATANIELDCQGYSIISDSVDYYKGFTNLVNYSVVTNSTPYVHNCIFGSFYYPIMLTGNFTVENSKFINGLDLGEVYFYNVDSGIFRNNTIYGSNVGLEVEPLSFGGVPPVSTGTTYFIYNEIYNTGYPLSFYTDVSNLNVSNNYIHDISGAVIDTSTFGASNKIIFNNNIFNVSSPIFYLSGNSYYNASDGGNYWIDPSDTGYSQTCDNLNDDAYCDDPYNLGGGYYDELPLINAPNTVWTVTTTTTTTTTTSTSTTTVTVPTTTTLLPQPSGISGMLTDVGQGTGSLLTSISLPLVVLLILLSAGGMVTVIFSKISEGIGKKV